MDIGLDFVINFNIVLYNVVRIYCKLIDLSMYPCMSYFVANFYILKNEMQK